MSSNSYVIPYSFTQPPPNYSLNNSWNYNWTSQSGHNVRGAQDNRSPTAPPLPPGLPPPPPPPPPPPSNPRSALSQSSHTNISSPNSDRRSLVPQFRSRRYGNNNSGQYSSTTSPYGLPGQYSSSGGQYSSQGQYSPSTGQYSSSGHYSPAAAQYGSNSPGMYSLHGSQNYPRNYYGKRKTDTDSDGLKKQNKKKKKPLSQNVPQRKDWSVLDAKKALTIEKEYNKRHKSQSLIIKFPDLELNRDIVSKFHTGIDNVHFQQPSTPRFCFVTLKDSVDPELVIKELNKIPFGQGYLTAEYKKDREDEVNIGPEDIDPLTLYVGNLAQEVTKDDMVHTYPKQKRIDIGYAKKMKYTRYAFISFKNVDDSIAAFKKTHATQMYSKSLIVRFRRLNGTVGMPGEPKPQLPQRIESSENPNDSHNINTNHTDGDHNNGHSDVETERVGMPGEPKPQLPQRIESSENPHDSHNINTNHTDGDHNNGHSDVEMESCTNSSLAPWEMVDVSQWETESDLSSIKQPNDDSDYEEDVKPSRQFSSPFMPGDLDLAFSMHRPKLIPEVKKERDCEEHSLPGSVEEENSDFTPTYKNKQAKSAVRDSESVKERTVSDNETNDDSFIMPVNIKVEQDLCQGNSLSNENTYEALRFRYPQPLGSIAVQVKEEPSPDAEPTIREDNLHIDEASGGDKSVPDGNTGGSLWIKSEPVDKDDENDGDKDDTTDDSDGFDFNNVLSHLEARMKRLKKMKRTVP